MPSQSSCFQRLDEIIPRLWGLDTRYLDCQAVGGPQSVARRQPHVAAQGLLVALLGA